MTSEIESSRLQEAFSRLVATIAENHQSTPQLGIAAIAEGGIVFGQRLAKELSRILNREIPCGVINAAFHRDDIGAKPIPKAFHRTDLPFPVDDACVLLADDVIGSGRTARAALSELFDQGRPEKVELIILCDRGGRALPLQPDYCGLVLEATADQTIKVELSDRNNSEDRILITSNHD